MKGLYAYFGRFGDHRLPVPGHPLYQMFFVNALAKEYGVDRFDFYYYDSEYPDVPDINDRFEILSDVRCQIRGKLVEKDGISISEAMSTKYDIVFLKYRFRNYSRLSENSLDRLKFEKLLEFHKDKCVIIDTDAEVKESYPRLISFFADSKYYGQFKRVTKMIPVLREDINRSILRGITTSIAKERQLTFIGNGYSKEGLFPILEKIKKETDISIFVQGKHKQQSDIYTIIPRAQRAHGYTCLARSLFTLQMSKPNYLTYDFMAPRIFESYLLSTLCFSQNSFMGGFSKFNGAIDLLEKIKYLTEIDSNEYFNILTKEIDIVYDNLERCVKNSE